MKSRAQLFALVVVIGALGAGLVALYRLRLGRGDFFPPYSSLRSDPLGTRVLHESLTSLPHLQVTRWLLPLEQLPASPARTIVLGGLSAEHWEHMSEAEFSALDAAARGGSRLIIALRATEAPEEVAGEKSTPSTSASPGAKQDDAKKSEAQKSDAKKTDASPVPREDPAEEADENVPKFVNLGERWQIKLMQRPLFGVAQRGPLAPSTLAAEVRWESDIFFEPPAHSPWQTVYRRAMRPVLLERPLGVGSIVLAGDSYFLSNEALQRDRVPSLLVWAVGALPTVEFVESHLGVLADPGVATLARRYGLSGAFFTFLLLALLFVWRRTALFAPGIENHSGMVLEYNQTAGLEALLRRAVPPNELGKVCAAEWRTSARASDLAKVDAALAATPKTASATETYNAIVRALRHR